MVDKAKALSSSRSTHHSLDRGLRILEASASGNITLADILCA
jgi:hypothetical protein